MYALLFYNSPIIKKKWNKILQFNNKWRFFAKVQDKKYSLKFQDNDRMYTRKSIKGYDQSTIWHKRYFTKEDTQVAK